MVGMSNPAKNETGSEEPSGQIPPLTEMFDQYRARLRLMVDLRIDRRIRSRVDASDVIQEAFIDAVRRYSSYKSDAKMSPYVWLRFLTLQQLQIAHRRHLGAKSRTATIEERLDFCGAPAVDSGSVAEYLVGEESSPSVKVARHEEIARMATAIDDLDEVDREILMLRHFEQLEYAEIGEILNLNRSTTWARYRRAVKKLGSVLVK